MFNKNSAVIYIILGALLASFSMSVFATGLPPTAGGGDMATDTSGFVLKYAKYIIYGTGGVVFVIASFWIIGAINDWRSGKPGGSLGNVALMFFIAIAATVIVSYLLKTGLDILTENLV